jgi:hypothetical protein
MRTISMKVPDALAGQFVRLVAVYRQSGRPDPLGALIAVLSAIAAREEPGIEIVVRGGKSDKVTR